MLKCQEDMEDKVGSHKSEIEKLHNELKGLKEEIEDLRLLHETTLDHSTTIENELEEKNQRINNLLTSMKMYLSE